MNKVNQADNTEIRSASSLLEAQHRIFASRKNCVLMLGFSLVIAMSIRLFVVQSFVIPSTSMAPLLLVGDYIVASRMAYGLRSPLSGEIVAFASAPQKGDVVIFSRFSEFEDVQSDRSYIKRVVAVPGDIVEVRDYRSYVNGKPIALDKEDDWRAMVLRDPATRSYGPLKLGSAQYFVLGDNRNNSKDSRFFGPVNGEIFTGRRSLSIGRPRLKKVREANEALL